MQTTVRGGMISKEQLKAIDPRDGEKERERRERREKERERERDHE